jgi:phosphatidylserine decarboxylase
MKLTTTLIIIVLYILYFYRTPNSCSNFDDNVIVSPSYGTVMEILENSSHYHIAIFLSPLDVHVQYFPCEAVISDIIYDKTGKFELAYNVNKSRYNEKCIHKLSTKFGYIDVYQIAGFLVRRIDYYKNINDKVKVGDKLGIIHFGSRVDITLPKISTNGNQLKILIKKGDKMCGGRSIIAMY